MVLSGFLGQGVSRVCTADVRPPSGRECGQNHFPSPET
ncbi:hypothetical protein BQ8420_07830 [Nocardiopsis sp. JB363]|nr:hypothetical protein BQ8420_07830 [Nocardiopsis sp. JB363]